MTPAPCFRCRSAPRASAPRFASLSALCEDCGSDAEREAEDANEELLARSHERLAAAEASERPRVVKYWEQRGRVFVARQAVLPAPVKTDRWGRPIR